MLVAVSPRDRHTKTKYKQQRVRSISYMDIYEINCDRMHETYAINCLCECECVLVHVHVNCSSIINIIKLKCANFIW